MSTILILYSTTDGHTQKICQYLQSKLEQRSHLVTLIAIEDYLAIELASFDKIVIGASIRYGKHHKNVYRFVEQHKNLLQSKANGFFSVNVVARKPDKNHASNNPYLQKFLRQISWQPALLDVFAGEIDYKKYRFFDRLMIRLIMYITNGPTDLSTVTDFTNWQRVEEFAQAISDS